jgi:hypothetical protein
MVYVTPQKRDILAAANEWLAIGSASFAFLLFHVLYFNIPVMLLILFSRIGRPAGFIL